MQVPDICLNNGVRLPAIGYGTYRLENDGQAYDAVRYAIDAGYRSFDTATLYQNEAGVGKALRTCGLPREELFVTTKLQNRDQGFASTLQAFARSQERMELEYIDCYLVHWPGKTQYIETYQAMEQLYREGKVRAIGVCNFLTHHLKTLLEQTQVCPAIDQIELHPYLQQRDTVAFCRQQGIQVEAWRPLMKGGQGLGEDCLARIASKYQKTPAQVILRWDIQQGIRPLPKSAHLGRMRENIDVFDFELTQEEMAQISGLERGERLGPDPDTFFG